MRPRRHALPLALAIALLGLLAACGSSSAADGRPEPEPTTRAGTASPAPRPSAPEAATAGQIEIYAAVIKRLITRDHTFGSAKSPFDRVYVNDRPDEGIFGASGAQAPFSPEVQVGIAQALHGDFAFEFVEPKRARQITDRIFAGADDLDVLLTLGTIDTGADERRVEVENRLYCGGLCGQAMTYVVELRHGEWAITGTTGTYVIS